MKNYFVTIPGKVESTILGEDNDPKRTPERVRLKKNAESNDMRNETDVNNVNQCKCGNENSKQNYNLG